MMKRPILINVANKCRFYRFAARVPPRSSLIKPWHWPSPGW